jgi:molybdopterin molybdotransferase
MKPLAEVQEHTLSHITTLPEILAPLEEAAGLRLSRPVHARTAVPPFDNTAVDGFAICAADCGTPPRRLRVVGTIAAGMDPSGLEVTPGTAYRIMTGAVVPRGTAAVVMVEDTRTEGDEVLVTTETAVGDNVRTQGSDLAPGDLVFEAGTRIGPAVLGVLASLGLTQVPVYRRARIGVISTGDELSDAAALPPGKIRDSNRPSLMAAITEAGALAVDLGCVPDDPEALRSAFAHAVRTVDAVVTSGGVSVGDFDYTKMVLDELASGAITWFQVAIKPAKPYAFGMAGSTPIFGLPGNPVSALVSFELFVRPSIQRMHGAIHPHRPRLRAIARTRYRNPGDGKLHFVRSLAEVVDGELTVRPEGVQSSHVLSGLARGNCLALVPDGVEIVPGAPIEVLLTGDLEGNV